MLNFCYRGATRLARSNKCTLRRSVVLIALLSACSRNNEGAARQKPDGPPIGHWERLPQGPESFDMSGHTFLTNQYFAWGGNGAPLTPFLFDVTNNTWKAGSYQGCPINRGYPAAVWTGLEVLVWGGEDNDSLATKEPAGAYNVGSDSWRIVSSAGAPSPRVFTTPVWSGKEMIIWGGGDTRTNWNAPPVLGDGFAYNPSTDSWRTISNLGAPSARAKALFAWTGEEMLVWGGLNNTSTIRVGDPNRKYLVSGAAYDPNTDTWRAMSTVNAPTQRDATVSTWTGTEFLVWVSTWPTTRPRHA